MPEKIFSNRSKLKRRERKFSFNLRTYIVVDFSTHLSPRISAVVFDGLQNFLVVRKREFEISSTQRLRNLYYRQTVTHAYRGSANFFHFDFHDSILLKTSLDILSFYQK